MPGVQNPHCSACSVVEGLLHRVQRRRPGRPGPRPWCTSPRRPARRAPCSSSRSGRRASTVQAPQLLVSQPTTVPTLPSLFAQVVDQQRPRLDLVGVAHPVDGDVDLGSSDLHARGAWSGQLVPTTTAKPVSGQPATRSSDGISVGRLSCRHGDPAVVVDAGRPRCRSCAPLPPQRRAMISAAIDTAVSSGVRAPTSRPIGACSRASSSSVRPSSRSRASRSSWVRREPIAPDVARAAVRSATSSSGTSNFGSWVSTQTTVRSSTCRCHRLAGSGAATRRRPRRRPGSACAVANTGRASHTVTR